MLFRQAVYALDGFDSGRDPMPPRDSVKSILHAVLWAVSRAPPLVDEVQKVERRDKEPAKFSSLLRRLGRRGGVADGSSLSKDVLDAISTLLARVNTFETMSMWDALTSLLGICGDSQEVIMKASESLWRVRRICTAESCDFSAEEVNPEEQIYVGEKTTTETVDDFTSPDGLSECPKCGNECILTRKTLMSFARCLIFGWTQMRPQMRPHGSYKQLDLLLRLPAMEGEAKYRLSSCISFSHGQYVCAVREGAQWFMLLEGQRWSGCNPQQLDDMRPCLALYLLIEDNPAHTKWASTASPSHQAPNKRVLAATTSHRGKRSRNEAAHHPGTPCIHCSGAGGRGASSAEAIEVVDDDNDNNDGNYDEDKGEDKRTTTLTDSEREKCRGSSPREELGWGWQNRTRAEAGQGSGAGSGPGAGGVEVVEADPGSRNGSIGLDRRRGISQGIQGREDEWQCLALGSGLGLGEGKGKANPADGGNGSPGARNGVRNATDRGSDTAGTGGCVDSGEDASSGLGGGRFHSLGDWGRRWEEGDGMGLDISFPKDGAGEEEDMEGWAGVEQGRMP
ncbi:unnamed protein product, partial [Discosporangium mesarthrocarpum]